MLWYLLEAPRIGAFNENHNMCFCGDIREIRTWIYLLSGVMIYPVLSVTCKGFYSSTHERTSNNGVYLYMLYVCYKKPGANSIINKLVYTRIQ